MMNYYRHVDTKLVQFDFVTCSPVAQLYDNEIINRGGRVHRLPSRSRRPLAYMWQLSKLLRTYKYETVHIHQNSASMAMDAFVAQLCGVKAVIGHSHNTFCNVLWQHRLFKPFVNYLLDYRFACSEAAGHWVFNKAKFSLINNAIDTEKYAFDAEQRKEIREELGIDNKFVVGFIGRLHEQKNPFRLIDIFAELHKQRENAVLVLLGEGHLRQNMEEYTKANGVSDSCLFLGHRKDVPKILMGFDVFLMPSLYEGLPVVLVEAEASGLKCVISDYVPAINLTNRLQIIRLSQPNEEWIKALVNVANCNRNVRQQIIDGGYDIHSEAKKLQEFYLEL